MPLAAAFIPRRPRASADLDGGGGSVPPGTGNPSLSASRSPISLRQLPGRMVLAVDRAEAVGFVAQPLFAAASLRLEGLLIEPVPALVREPGSPGVGLPGSAAGAASLSPPNPLNPRWRLLPLTDLLAIGPEAVTLPSRLHLRSLSERPALTALIDWAALPGEEGPSPRRWAFLFGRKQDPASFRTQAGAAGFPPPAGIRPAAGQPSWSQLYHLPVLTDQGEELGVLYDLLVERVGGRLVRIQYKPPKWWSRWLSPLVIPGSQVRAIGPDACVVTATAPPPPR